PVDAANVSTTPHSSAPTTPTSVGTPTSAGSSATVPPRNPDEDVVTVGGQGTDTGTSAWGEAARAVLSLAALAMLVAIGIVGVLVFLALRRTRQRRHAARSRDRVL